MRARTDQDDFNPIVYKHLAKRHAENMVNKGQVCVSLMSRFEQGYEDIRRDPTEGQDFSHAEDLLIGVGTINNRLTNFTVDAGQQNGLIYCTSLVDTERHRYPEYDATVKISDCHAFYKALSTGLLKHLAPKVPMPIGWAPVEYRVTKTMDPIESGMVRVAGARGPWRYARALPFFLKLLNYQHEREVRGAWDGYEPHLGPNCDPSLCTMAWHIFEVPELTQYVSHHTPVATSEHSPPTETSCSPIVRSSPFSGVWISASLNRFSGQSSMR